MLDPLEVAQRALRVPTVMFDVDDTLGFWQEAAIGALNARGYHFDPRTAPHRFDKAITPDDLPWYYAWLADPETVWTIAPDWHTVDLLCSLVAATVNVIVASNHERNAAVAETGWLRYWTKTDRISVRSEGPGTKQRIATSFGPSDPLVWVDDEPHMWPFAREGVTIAALIRPWTPPQFPPNIVPCPTVADIQRLVGVTFQPTSS